MEIKVGDVVKLKPVEQLMRDGWYLSNSSKEGLKHKDSPLRVGREMIEGGCLNKEAEVSKVVNNTCFYVKGESCLYDELMVEYVIPVEKSTLKVGDKVRLKSLDEILKLEGFYMDEYGDVVYDTGRAVALYGSEIKYCGEIFTVEVVRGDLKTCMLSNENTFLVSTLAEILTFIYEPKQEPINPNLVNLKQATKALINGECDAIRYHTNVSICAYKDKETGVFMVAKYRGEGTPLSYTNEPFFMHEDYLVNSKWELVVDNVKRKEIEKQKKWLIATLDTLYLLYGIDHETYTMIMDKVESI